MLKRVALGDGKWVLRRTIADRKHQGPIDSYQNRQTLLRSQAAAREKLAEKIRLNIERTWSGSDHQLMLSNRYNNEDGYDQYHTKKSTDPVIVKLAKIQELVSKHSYRAYDWDRFNGGLCNCGGRIGDKIRDFQYAVQQRTILEADYEFLRTMPMTRILDAWILEARRDQEEFSRRFARKSS